MIIYEYSKANDCRGQSLVETALMIPVLLMLILNAVNFGYFLVVTQNLTSATRNGIEYAIQGSSTLRNASLPAPGTLSSTTAATVSALIAQELGAFNKNNNLTVQVCAVGGSNASADPSCTNGQSADPESANGFALVRVDVTYKFQPLIPATPFSLAVLSIPACSLSSGTTTCVFSRHAEMRAMGS